MPCTGPISPLQKNPPSGTSPRWLAERRAVVVGLARRGTGRGRGRRTAAQPGGRRGGGWRWRRSSGLRSSADVAASRRWNCTTAPDSTSAPIARAPDDCVDTDQVADEEVALAVLDAILLHHDAEEERVAGQLAVARVEVLVQRLQHGERRAPIEPRMTLRSAAVTNIGSPMGRQPCATMVSTARLPLRATPTSRRGARASPR